MAVFGLITKLKYTEDIHYHRNRNKLTDVKCNRKRKEKLPREVRKSLQRKKWTLLTRSALCNFSVTICRKNSNYIYVGAGTSVSKHPFMHDLSPAAMATSIRIIVRVTMPDYGCNGFTLVSLLPNSSDLNRVEHIWDASSAPTNYRIVGL